MSQFGHADDCPACGYADLPEEDKALLGSLAAARHTRREPPPGPRPRPTTGPFLLIGGILMLVVSLGISKDTHPVVGVLAFAASVALLVHGSRVYQATIPPWQDEYDLRLAAFEAWRVEQAEVWLKRRANAQLWPCPTCGREDCPNQHSVTETVIRPGPFGTLRGTSYTDPR